MRQHRYPQFVRICHYRHIDLTRISKCRGSGLTSLPPGGDARSKMQWSKGTWISSRDDLRRFSGRHQLGRVRRHRHTSSGTQPNLSITSELSATGVLAANPEGVMKSAVPKHPGLRLDQDSYPRLCRQVLRRDGWRCQRCGASQDLQVHHIQPRSSLGGDVEENLSVLCSCLSSKNPSPR
jgi:hypothetical protein